MGVNYDFNQEKTPCTALEAAEIAKKEEARKLKIENDRREVLSRYDAVIANLRQQTDATNIQLKVQFDEIENSKKELAKTKRYNRVMMVISILSLLVAVASIVLSIVFNNI